MLAADILKIDLTEPERLFKKRDGLQVDYHVLVKEWHPDRNKDARAAEVLAHITTLYKKAKEKHEDNSWNPPGELTLHGTDSKTRTFKYRVKRPFELGSMYIGTSFIIFVIDRKHENLALQGLKGIGTIRYPNEKFQKALEQYFPKVERYFDTKDAIVIAIKKTPDEILLADLINHFGGRLPAHHAAWVMTSLYNLASLLTIQRMTLNGITANSVFVNPKMHSVALYGGWWYSAEAGKSISTLPPDVFKLAPRKLTADKKAVYSLDLDCIKAVGRECLGDPSGGTFRTDPSLPSWVSFLQLPATDKAIIEYENWVKALEAHGPRKFIKMDVTVDQVYPL